jgi:putative transposase
MTQAYLEDLHARALAHSDHGETIRSIAAALQIGPSCVSKWKKLRHETGDLKPSKINGHKKRVLSCPHAEWLRERIRSGPFALHKLTVELAARGVKTHQKAV